MKPCVWSRSDWTEQSEGFSLTEPRSPALSLHTTHTHTLPRSATLFLSLSLFLASLGRCGWPATYKHTTKRWRERRTAPNFSLWSVTWSVLGPAPELQRYLVHASLCVTVCVLVVSVNKQRVNKPNSKRHSCVGQSGRSWTPKCHLTGKNNGG